MIFSALSLTSSALGAVASGRLRWTLAVIVLALAGCAPQTDPAPALPAATTPGSATPLSAEATVSPQVQLQTPEPTSTRPPTLTPSPTRSTSFARASVYAVSHLPGGRLMVTIDVPGGVTASETYWALIGLTEFECVLQDLYPDRLYCIGPEPSEAAASFPAIIRVFPEGELVDVFEEEFIIPPRP